MKLRQCDAGIGRSRIQLEHAVIGGDRCVGLMASRLHSSKRIEGCRRVLVLLNRERNSFQRRFEVAIRHEEKGLGDERLQLIAILVQHVTDPPVRFIVTAGLVIGDGQTD